MKFILAISLGGILIGMVDRAMGVQFPNLLSRVVHYLMMYAVGSMVWKYWPDELR